jgi:hypothetical protein
MRRKDNNNSILGILKSIQAWTTFLQCAQKVETKTDILHGRLFGNCNITFQNKPLIFSSFLIAFQFSIGSLMINKFYSSTVNVGI